MDRREGSSAEAAFAERLRDAIVQAHTDGVVVEGGWPVLIEDPDLPDWDVVIAELAERDQ